MKGRGRGGAAPRPGVGGQRNAASNSLSKIQFASSNFDELAGSADGVTKAIAGIETGVHSLTSGLALATKVATGLKAAILGTGIGVLIAGVGFLVSRLRSAGDAVADLGEARIDTPRDSIDPRIRGVLGIRDDATVTRTASGGVRESTPIPGGRFERLFSSRSVEEAGTAIRARDIASAARAETHGAGRSREELALGEMEATVAVGRAAGDTSASFRAMRAEVEAARSAFVGLEAARTSTRFEATTTSARDAARTMAMSAEEAELYRLTLRSTTRTVGGLTIATTEAISPAEAHARRIREADEAHARGAFSAEEYFARVADSERAMHAETAALDEARRGLLELAGAREAMRLETPFERANREITRMVDLFMEGATSLETFQRGISAALGPATLTPMERLTHRLDEITQLEDTALAGAAIDAAMRGADTFEFDSTAFDRAKSEAVAAAEREVGRIELPAGPAALLRGSGEAVSMINALRRGPGGETTAERTVSLLDRLREHDAETARNTRETAEALRSITVRGI